MKRLMLYTKPDKYACLMAKNWLDSRNIDYIEIKLNPYSLTEKQVLYIFSKVDDLYEIINKSSNIYQKLKNNMDDYSLNDLAKLVVQHPELLKQPILMTKKNIAIGFNEDITLMRN